MALLATMLMTSLAACGGSNQGNADAKYKVGVIQLVQHPALDAATEGFVAALEEKLGEDVDVEIQNAANESATCATIANTYVSNQKDLIMANATPSLQAAMAATDSIPIVGTSITDYATALDISDWTGKTGTNVTGTSDLAPLDKQAEMLKEMFPDAKKVGILYCSAEPNSIYQSKTITAELEKLGLEVKEYTFSDSNDVAAVTTTAADNSDVLYIPTDNTAASCTETISGVVYEKNIPIIAGEEGICSGCGVATLSIDYYDIGYAAGEMAYDILVNGTQAGDMDIRFAPEVTKKYNATIAEKLQVQIPEDYEAIKEEE